MRLRLWAVMITALGLIAAACGGGAEETTVPATEPPATTAAPVTEPPTTTEAPAALGTADNPIQVLFVPSVDTQVIVSGGEIMADALEEATGLVFEVAVPTSYAATAEEMCAAPESTMGFIPGLLYVLATELCGVDVAFKAVRFGNSVYWAQILVPRDSDYTSIEDLEGLKWAYPDAGSTSGFMVPTVMFNDAGVTPGETFEAGSHNNAALAVYRGEADFGTTFYSPYLKPDGTVADVEAGEPFEIPDDLVSECAVTAEDRLFCGDVRVLDARASVRTEAPDIVQKVRILAISPSIPNDTLSFGSDFPADLRSQISDALVAFAETDAWFESIGNSDFYDWSGLAPATDAEYDFIRQMVALTGYTP